ncbi:sn-glycerol-3-phosphate ABC transporter ATP-binding protein UgpC [Alginatibacterium sediminis]|uniref:sn-glycerol-3-phosphate ABC transporter ATP-binding protein UgpC n=1 Tax=Alginatibacterium sediminis TaxID=2164068 RepID=A0A420EB52_9ALTE|nr:sn-glycerol-3-phosphate ABC transporter ATP-binding protein UgpC [Alginatibacterium sediminis]RKF17884.1 sn-glycerol-3-phosphate ABC transporter ATP-binding protein UgpC [Alginatibacterium sediminis]
MSGVKLEGVVKSYKDVTVVHGIDLEVKSKEFVVLVGPSGCGKSTTLRMLAGLEEISDGQVSIDDKVVNHIAPKDRDVAMVFQNYALYPHLSVAENIAFGLRIRKVPKPRIEELVKEVAHTLELTSLLERRPADLSGGQRQRVAMGRAIVRHPKVFLFDEPLSNLDAKLRTQMRAEIKQLHTKLGVTSVYVTHDQVEAMTLADRIVVMSDGRIEQIGTPMELFNNPINTFVATFIGSPPMNLISTTITSIDGLVYADISGNKCLLPQLENPCDLEVIIGIRPEYVDIVPVDNSSAVPIHVDLVETLGSEALLHCRIQESAFVVKVDTHGKVEHLKHLDTLYFRQDAITVFDKTTGRALSRSSVGCNA